MSEMIERVAAVLQSACSKEGMHVDAARHMARAAIEAMREPTPAMVERMPEYLADTSAEYVWECMIDAALEN